jgi:hypothetical protein
MEQPKPTVNRTEVEKIVGGYWIVYLMTLRDGGPEEGGWFYEAGDMIACVPCLRRKKVVQYHDEATDEFWDEFIEWLNKEEPQRVKNVCKMLVDEGYGKFDNEFRSTRPRHDSLRLSWSEDLVTHFPTDRPCYE